MPALKCRTRGLGADLLRSISVRIELRSELNSIADSFSGGAHPYRMRQPRTTATAYRLPKRTTGCYAAATSCGFRADAVSARSSCAGAGRSAASRCSATPGCCTTSSCCATPAVCSTTGDRPIRSAYAAYRDHSGFTWRWVCLDARALGLEERTLGVDFRRILPTAKRSYGLGERSLGPARQRMALAGGPLAISPIFKKGFKLEYCHILILPGLWT